MGESEPDVDPFAEEPLTDEDAIEVLLIAFGRLPVDRAMRALMLADTGNLQAWLTRYALERFRYGYMQGWEEGRENLERFYEQDWRPVAESVRALARVPTQEETRAARRPLIGRSDHPGGRVEWLGTPGPGGPGKDQVRGEEGKT